MNAVLLDESNKTKSIENYRSQIDESLDNLMVLIINAPEALIGKGERWIQNRKYEQSK